MQLPLFKGLEIHGSIFAGGCEEKLSAWATPLQEDLVERFRVFIASDERLMHRLFASKEVWIKPNITSGEPPQSGRTTQPLVLSNLINAIRIIRGKSTKIFVADSSVVGCDTRLAAELSGIKEVCDSSRVRFVDLRKRHFVQTEVPKPLIYQSLPVSEPFVSCETFKINIGKLKSTYGSPVSFCIKNTKGLLRDQEKIQFHLRGVQEALCDLIGCVKWDMAILEGLPMSELGRPTGNGPLGICTDILVLDGLFALLMRIPWKDALHIVHLAESRGLTELALKSLPGFEAFQTFCPPLSYTKTGIKHLSSQYDVSILDGKPCSACTESFAKALSHIKKARSNLENTVFVLGGMPSGPIHDQIESNSACFVGNCSFAAVASELEAFDFPDRVIQLWERSQKIPGCPPTIDSLKQLSGQKLPPNETTRVSEEILRAFEINFFQLLQKKDVYNRIVSLIPQNSVSFDAMGKEALVAGELICAAICHQINWEFLRNRVFAAISSGENWWLPDRILEVRPETISKLLSGYHDPNRVKAVQRANILKSLAQVFQGSTTSYLDLVTISAEADGSVRNIVNKLELCKAFREDPARKKMQVFLHSMACYDDFRYLDELCEPAIDYHIIRLYLRRGDVYPTSKLGVEFLDGKVMRHSSTVTALRQIVSEALKLSAQIAGLPIRVLNGIEWWVGRSVCLRDAPDCALTGHLGVWLKGSHLNCPFRSACFAFNHDPHLLKVREPSYSGSFY